MSNRYQKYFEEIGVPTGGPGVFDVTKTPEVLYKEFLLAGLYEKAADVSEKITDCAAQLAAQEEIIQAVKDKARFSVVSSVLQKLGGGITKPILPSLLARFKSQKAFGDAVQVIRLYKSVLWTPIIEEFYEELVGKDDPSGVHIPGEIDVLEAKLAVARQSGSQEEEEDLTRAIERVDKAVKSLICLREFGAPDPPAPAKKPQQGDGDRGNQKRPFRDNKRNRD